MIQKDVEQYMDEQLSKIKDIVPSTVVDKLKKSIENYPVEITKDEIDKIIELAIADYKNSLINPGEAIGVVAAQ